MDSCDRCGTADGFLFSCPECGRRFCADHHVPADHACEGPKPTAPSAKAPDEPNASADSDEPVDGEDLVDESQLYARVVLGAATGKIVGRVVVESLRSRPPPASGASSAGAGASGASSAVDPATSADRESAGRSDSSDEPSGSTADASEIAGEDSATDQDPNAADDGVSRGAEDQGETAAEAAPADRSHPLGAARSAPSGKDRGDRTDYGSGEGDDGTTAGERDSALTRIRRRGGASVRDAVGSGRSAARGAVSRPFRALSRRAGGLRRGALAVAVRSRGRAVGGLAAVATSIRNSVDRLLAVPRVFSNRVRALLLGVIGWFAGLTGSGDGRRERGADSDSDSGGGRLLEPIGRGVARARSLPSAALARAPSRSTRVGERTAVLAVGSVLVSVLAVAAIGFGVTPGVGSIDALSQVEEPPSEGDNRSAAALTAVMNVTAVERHVFDNVDTYRTGLDRPSLEDDPRLSEVAAYHSRSMRDGSFVAHDSPDGETRADRLDRFEHSCETYGGVLQLVRPESVLEADENVPTEELEAELGNVIVDGWREDDANDEFLRMEEWGRMGVGIAADDEGRLFVTATTCARE